MPEWAIHEWDNWKDPGWTTSLTANLVKKTMIDRPFRARFVRIHPVCWHGPKMALRVEIYAKSTPFDWSELKKNPTLKCGDSDTPGTIAFSTAAAFASWTDGLDGGGGTYQSEPDDIIVDGKDYTFLAYQRRVVRGRGTLSKQLVCFREKNSNAGERCCVAKASRPLGGEWPEQTLETKMF